MQFEARVNGIPCQIRVTHIVPPLPARTTGHPDTWLPADGGEIEYDVLDRKGRPAPWLRRKLRDRDEDAIYRRVFGCLDD